MLLLLPSHLICRRARTDTDNQSRGGTLKFPLDQPLPLGLIRSIVQFRIKENSERSPIKGK
jgi:uncharacterized protein YdhG (YjbR/CyaY superfamily)